MARDSVTIKGLDKVMKHLELLADPKNTLDNALLITATVSLGELQRATLTKSPRSISFTMGRKTVTAQNLATGDLARSWTNPLKTNQGYVISNDKQAGRHSLANIIDKGRRALIAEPGHMFYIPLNRKGQNKPPGAHTTGLKSGVDFIMTRRIRAFKGNPYLQSIRERGSRYLTRNVIDHIRKALAA